MPHAQFPIPNFQLNIMSEQDKEHKTVGKFRDKLSDNLGINAIRKEDIYLDICHSVSFRDVS
ncbi:MAG: hypothetical protein AAFS12_18425, partial [Cyanobacteria bacterium J06632_19]